MDKSDAVFIVIGADVIFNDGLLTNKLIECFYDILKSHFDSTKPATNVISQEEDIVNAGFGC